MMMMDSDLVLHVNLFTFRTFIYVLVSIETKDGCGNSKIYFHIIVNMENGMFERKGFSRM